ncbi:hypothetical protein YC2023_094564 [Brassica napus]
MRQSNPHNTKDRDQAPTQKIKKTGQRKNNHRKNKVTTNAYNLTEKEGEEKQEYISESFPSDGEKHCTPERTYLTKRPVKSKEKNLQKENQDSWL